MSATTLTCLPPLLTTRLPPRHFHLRVSADLQNNRLTRLEGLSALLALRILDVSHNALTRLEGLGSLPVLETLLVTDNQLCDEASMSHLLDCGSLAELDVSHNRIR